MDLLGISTWNIYILKLTAYDHTLKKKKNPFLMRVNCLLYNQKRGFGIENVKVQHLFIHVD